MGLAEIIETAVRASALATPPNTSRTDPATSWLPCTDCLSKGGWDAETVNTAGHRVWPNEHHEHGRPQQHFAWERGSTEAFFQSGRGVGKTRSAAEDRAALAWKYPRTTWYAVGNTASDTRDYCFEGDSGLVSVAERRGWITSRDKAFNRSLGALELVLDNGSRIYGRSAEKPERLRGPNAHGAWVDEPGSMPNAQQVKRQLDMLVRAKFPDGFPTTVLWTGTPSRTPFMRSMVERAQSGLLIWRRGHTFDNAANLDQDFLDRLEQYKGTEWGRQELEGLLLSSVEGAMWDDETIEAMRVDSVPQVPAPLYAAVCVDPSASTAEVRDECGIITIVAGADRRGYITADDTRRGLPHVWAETVLDAVERASDLSKYTSRPVIIVETNFMKEWVLMTMREAMRKRGVTIPIVEVHATEGKQTRAAPVASLCRGPDPRLRIVGVLPKLEDELVSWVEGDPSPNRLDAMVWGARHLFGLVTSKQAVKTGVGRTATAGMRTRAM